MKIIVCEVQHGELYGMYNLRIDDKTHKSLEEKDLLDFAVKAKLKELGMKMSQFVVREIEDLPEVEDVKLKTK